MKRGLTEAKRSPCVRSARLGSADAGWVRAGGKSFFTDPVAVVTVTEAVDGEE